METVTFIDDFIDDNDYIDYIDGNDQIDDNDYSTNTIPCTHLDIVHSSQYV